ncbi:MAG: hypothetical protein ACREJ3_05725 [Polyangiaceae bacterium]
MLASNPFVVVGIACVAGAFGTAIAACSSSPAASSSALPVREAGSPLVGPACLDAGLKVAFNPMYSAYDGKHTFAIPALVVGSNGTVTWSADSSMVGMQTDSERPNEVLITMLQAGTVNIYVESSDGKCGSAVLNISAATQDDWMIGEARYNNGMSLHLSGPATSGTGSPLEQGTGGPACTSCHGETATTGPYTDVSHTPEQTGGFSDNDLLGIILHGNFPDGGYFDPTIAIYPAWHGFHQWTDIKEDQQRGIITYLRSLTPRPQKGSVNFGAFGMDAGASGDIASDSGADGGMDAGTPVIDGAAGAGDSATD